MKHLIIILLFASFCFGQTYVKQDTVADGTENGAYSVGHLITYVHVGTRVAVHGSYSVTKLSLKLYHVLTPTHKFIISINQTNAATRDPSSTRIWTAQDSVAVSATNLNTGAWYDYVPSAPVDLSSFAGDTVWVMLHFSAVDNTNKLNWIRKNAQYKEGFAFGSNESSYGNSNSLATLVRLYSDYVPPATTTRKRNFGNYSGWGGW